MYHEREPPFHMQRNLLVEMLFKLVDSNKSNRSCIQAPSKCKLKLQPTHLNKTISAVNFCKCASPKLIHLVVFAVKSGARFERGPASDTTFLPASQGSPQASSPPPLGVQTGGVPWPLETTSKGQHMPALAGEQTHHRAEQQPGKPATCTAKETPDRQANGQDSVPSSQKPRTKNYSQRGPLQGTRPSRQRLSATSCARLRAIVAYHASQQIPLVVLGAA